MMPSTTTPEAATFQVAEVAFDSRTAGIDAVYTYECPFAVQLGDGVIAPLGNRSGLGFVISSRVVDAQALGFDPARLKPISSVVEGVRLPPSLIELLTFVAAETLTSLPVALSLGVPPGIKDRVVGSWTAIAEKADEDLTPSQREMLKVLLDHGGPLTESRTRPIAAGAKRQLRVLKRKGLVEERLTISQESDSKRLTGQLQLAADEKKIEEFLRANGRKRPAQSLTLMRLQGSEESSFSVAEIKALAGSTDQTIRGLLAAGLIEKVDEERFSPAPAPLLNEAQQSAVDRMVSSITNHEHETFLLFGVTGSGKTEVYLRVAAEALRRGRQVLFLVPEIALTAQMIAHLKGRFGRAVAVLHSNLAPGERLATWLQIARGEAAVVLGARSALFAPLNNVGVIILDEEHESSYKQESAPRYHAVRAARFLAQKVGAPLILGSATPNVETYYSAQNGDIELLRLPNRAVEKSVLPPVIVQDLTEVYRERHASLFSPLLQTKIRETLGREEQIILFLNRRAYAPFLNCRDCGHTFSCHQCSTSLSYHKRSNVLKCHHCGHQEPAPDICPSCGGDRVAAFGTGAEKVEEAVRHEFPDARVARLDRDVSQRRGALEEVLAEFRTGELNVLVGTQMVAKGLDFPNVTLVGVIAADIALNLPDFRASERTFQLLTQVAGRAGRGQRPGEVVIQTMNPKHEAILCAQTHDFERLYAAVIREREDADYPPFCRLVNVVASSEDATAATHAVTRVAEQAAKLGLVVRGPVACPLERLQNQWRIHCLLKLPLNFDLELLRPIVRAQFAKGVSVMVDVDPYNML